MAQPLDTHSIQLAITAMLVRCAHRIDDDDLEAWPNFFVENGVYQIISRESHDAGHKIGVMLCQGRGMMNDRIRAMRQANIFAPQRYTHILGASEFGAHGSDVAVRTNFHVVRIMEDGASQTFATGKYLDVVTADEKPMFRERIVVLDSRRIDTLLVVPL